MSENEWCDECGVPHGSHNEHRGEPLHFRQEFAEKSGRWTPYNPATRAERQIAAVREVLAKAQARLASADEVLERVRRALEVE